MTNVSQEYLQAIRQYTEPETLFDIEQMMEMPTPDWLIEGILVDKSLSLLVGQPGVGKSFVALSMGMAIASSINWQNHRVCDPGPLVYVVAEGVHGFGPRVRSWCQEYEQQPEARFWPRALNVMDPDDTDRFIESCEHSLSRIPKLVVLDTLARCMVGGDENNATDMGLFVHGANRIQRELDTSVMIIHHPTKSGDWERGSGALKGAIDLGMVLRKTGTGGVLELSCNKQKDYAEFKPETLRLKPVGESVVVSKPFLQLTDRTPEPTPSSKPSEEEIPF